MALVVVCMLIRMGDTPSTAIKKVRKTRSGTIRNPIQLIYIRIFYWWWRNQIRKFSHIAVADRLRESLLKCYESALSDDAEEVAESHGDEKVGSDIAAESSEDHISDENVESVSQSELERESIPVNPEKQVINNY